MFPARSVSRFTSLTVIRACVALTLLMIVINALALTRSPFIIAAEDSARSRVSAQLLGHVLKDAGYIVQYVEMPVEKMAGALANGDIHAVPEIASDKLDQAFAKAIDAGYVTDLGFRQAAPSEPKYKKLAWSRASKKWAGAVKMLKNMTMPEADTANMAKLVDGGKNVDDVVARWLTDHPKRWAKWKSVAKNWMKP